MFWEVFVKLCNIKGLKPNNACKDLNLSNATATHWKNGAIPNADTLCKIADYFDCSVDYLLGRESEKVITVDTKNGVSVTDGSSFSVGGSFTMNNDEHQISKDAIEIDNILKSLSFEKRAELMNLICQFKKYLS